MRHVSQYPVFFTKGQRFQKRSQIVFGNRFFAKREAVQGTGSKPDSVLNGQGRPSKVESALLDPLKSTLEK